MADFSIGPTTQAAPQGGGPINAVVEGAKDSARAAGMMLGLYKPKSPDEAQRLRRKFFADAAGVAAGLGAGLATETAGSSLTIPIIARTILADVLGGAAGGAAQAGVEGGDVGKQALLGGALALPFGAVGGVMRSGAAKAAEMAAENTAAKVVPEAAAGARLAGVPFQASVGGKGIPPYEATAVPAPAPEPSVAPSPFHMGSGVDTNTTTATLVRALGKKEEPARWDANVAAGSPPPTKAWEFDNPFTATGNPKPTTVEPSGPTDLGEVTAVPAPPRRAVQVILNTGVKGSTREEAVSQAVQAGRKAPFAEEGPANDIATLNEVQKNVLSKVPDSDSAAGKAWLDVQKIYRRGVNVAGNALAKMGPAGSWLADTMDQVLGSSERFAARDMIAMRSAYKGLSRAERLQVTGILNGENVAATPEVEAAANKVRAILDNVGQAGQDAGLPEMSSSTGKVRPFQYTGSAWPYQYDSKAAKAYLTVGSPENKAAVQRIMSMNLGAETEPEAQALLKRFMTTPVEFRTNHLQLARDLALPNFERDPMKVLPLYLTRAWKRIEAAKAFGPQDQLAAQAISNLKAGGQDWQMASDVYKAFSDKLPLGYSGLIRATRDFNTVSLLSTAGIAQFAQHANTIGYTGFKNFMRGLGAYFTKDGRQYAARTGAYLQELMGEMLPEEVPPGLPFLNMGALKNVITGPNRAANWLQYIGLTPLDKANRAIAALAGRFHADEVAAKYAAAVSGGRAGTVERLGRELSRLKLNPEDVVANGGRLNADQRLIASQAVSHITQFRGSVLDMPAWRNTTPMGKLAYLFKTFSVQQFRFVNLLKNEAMKGNIAPAVRYMTAAGVMTPAVGMAIQAARGRPSPDNPSWAYVEAALNAGAIGIAYDGLRAAAEGPEWLMGFVGGPTASQLAALTSESVQSVTKQNPTPLMRDALRHVPMVGPHLANWLTPTGR